MRPIEIAVVVALLPYVLHLLSPSRGESSWFGLFAFIAALLSAWHFFLEGYRWQMLPAYCLVIVFLICECARLLWTFRVPYLAGMAALLFEIAAIVLATALPVFKLPELTGPYKIGTQIRHVVDEGRQDPFSDSSRARELMVQIWYPVEASAQGPFVPYRDRRITTFKDSRFSLVETHSVVGAGLSHLHPRYPVLLYTPSWSGIRTENTFQVEELASYGYVVIGIDHPYSSEITVFPDGRIARRKFVGGEDYSSEAAFGQFLRTARQQVEIRAQDVSFLIDMLERLNANDPAGLLIGRLDLTRIGIFGFSLGGGTAAQACWLDRRLKAGVNWGGMIAGESANQGTFAPFLFMFEALYEAPPYAPNTDLSNFDPSKRREIEFTWEQFAQMKRSLAESGGYWMTIHGIGHLNFSDSPFFSPLRLLRYSRADPERIARIISQYTRAFFDRHLKNIEQPLLADPSRSTPEVRFEVWNVKTSGVHSR